MQKQFSVRDHINVNDIIEEGKSPFRYGVTRVPDKNIELLADEVLGKKKLLIKNSSPLDP